MTSGINSGYCVKNLNLWIFLQDAVTAVCKQSVMCYFADDETDMDVHDRALLYYRLLKANVKEVNIPIIFVISLCYCITHVPFIIVLLFTTLISIIKQCLKITPSPSEQTLNCTK